MLLTASFAALPAWWRAALCIVGIIPAFLAFMGAMYYFALFILSVGPAGLGITYLAVLTADFLIFDAVRLIRKLPSNGWEAVRGGFVSVMFGYATLILILHILPPSTYAFQAKYNNSGGLSIIAMVLLMLIYGLAYFGIHYPRLKQAKTNNTSR